MLTYISDIICINMATKIIQYSIILITGLLIDGIWLGVVAKNFYKKYLGFLMNDTANLKVAFLFYLVFALGVLVFIISPALVQNFTTWKVLLYGALLGLVIYGGYDFTNQSIIKNWPVVITIADLAWGICMSAMTASISYILIKLFKVS